MPRLLDVTHWMSKPRIVLVCGGRLFDDWSLLKTALNCVLLIDSIRYLVHGAARGADTMADDWAAEAGVERRPYPIRRPLEDGYQRNARMLDSEPEIDLVVAFPGGNGTADMVRRARRRGIYVMEVA